MEGNDEEAPSRQITRMTCSLKRKNSHPFLCNMGRDKRGEGLKAYNHYMVLDTVKAAYRFAGGVYTPYNRRYCPWEQKF